jgi:hypothetical protein
VIAIQRQAMASAFPPKQSLFPLFQRVCPNRHSLRTVVHAGIGDGQATTALPPFRFQIVRRQSSVTNALTVRDEGPILRVLL